MIENLFSTLYFKKIKILINIKKLLKHNNANKKFKIMRGYVHFVVYGEIGLLMNDNFEKVRISP